ncbi:hypothetical protein ACQ4PT_002183 [Festuca glaucescens]
MWPWESKAAVDERFYADHHTTFTVTRSDTWRGPGFNVVNFAGGPAVMHARTVDLGNGTIRSLVLLDAASHGQIVSVEESWLGIGSGGHRQWEALRARGASGTGDRLFVAVDRTRLFQMGNTVHVFLHGNSSGGLVPDFVVRGSYCYGTMTVSRGSDGGGDSVAQIQKESSLWSWMVDDDTYTVWIHRGVDQVFVLALAVILDQILNPAYEKKSCHFECNKR